MTTTTTKTVRVTKAQRFEDIKALLNGEAVKYGTSVEDAIKVLDHEMELLAKKNSGSSSEKKPTATQKDNEGYKELILEYLTTIPADSDGATCTEILKGIPALGEFQVQKVSALMRQLRAAGRVTSKEVKGKALFSLT
jgi:hypothetical protein